MKSGIKTITIIMITVLFISMSAYAEQTELEFWTINLSPRFDDYFYNMIDEYEQNNPGVRIVWEDVSFSAIKQKLLYNIAEGNSPDVVNLSTELARSLIQEALLLPINEEYKDDYYPGLWQAGVFAGKSYAFPWYVSTKILIYNKDIFLVSGLDPSQPPATLKELADYGKVIKEKTGIYGFMPQIRLHHEFIRAGIPLFKGAGKKEPGFAGEKAEEIIRWYCDLKEEGVIPEETISDGFNMALARYMEGELGILITGPQFLDRIKEKAPDIYEVSGVAPLPHREKELLSAAVMNMVVPASSGHREVAVDFAHFITGDYAQLLFAKAANVLPSVTSAIKDDYFRIDKGELIDRARQISVKQLENAIDMTLAVPDADLLIKGIDEEFGRAFYGKISPETAVGNMERRWKEILGGKQQEGSSE
ncbi:MAG: ABC transporter substrate-binding protein [Halanaerobiales bacterium]